MGEIAWNLVALMNQHGIRPLDIEREAIRLGYPIGKNVIYRVATPEGPQRIDRDTLAAIIAAMRSLLGREIVVGDVIRFEPLKNESASAT